MKEAYVTYETAKLLKEKEFDWGCCSYWCIFPNGDRVHTDYGHFANHNGVETDKFVSRPTQQMAMRWLREEHGIMITPDRDKIVNVAPEPFYDYWCTIRHNGNEYWVSSLDLPDAQHYTEYEDVVEAALQYCLTNLI